MYTPGPETVSDREFLRGQLFMVKVDLITGFLGAGKTTFIRKYVSYLLNQGEKICILENDHGAINVDMMLLSDLRSDRLGIEMVAGGCDYDCHRRRFRTKLITMAMLGYDRVLIEPSGIFDVDEFFDILHEDPLDRRYEIANVLTIVSADLEEDLSEEADYLLASQAAQAGRLIYSRVQEADARAIEAVTAHVNRALAAIKCSRTFSPGENITVRDWDRMTEEDWQEIMTAGYAETGFEKRFSMDETGFQALFFMRISIPKDQVLANIRRIWQDPDVGRIFRIKGFLIDDPDRETWIEVNATAGGTRVTPIPRGQE
ncbi:MAG TPA: GTPase (G3E family), partial [Lachnospiraceae bacterium]|nr:GTPase (G3E family) [Lachnospiraceae bacterium]